MTDVREQLRACMDKMPVIDAHEHMRPEDVHLTSNYSFFHLFVPYIMYDLYSAGMPHHWIDRAPATDEEVEQCWRDVEPVWKYVKHGSYARSTRRAIKEFWGIDDITSSNYRDFGPILNATRVPGHYRKIFVEKCGIKRVLNQTRHHSHPEDFMEGAFVLNPSGARVKRYFEKVNQKATFDEYCESIRNDMRAAKAEGAVQIKFDVSHGFCTPPDPETALAQFEAIRRGEELGDCLALGRLICDKTLSFVAEVDLVAAVHTGVWHDIRDQNPEHLFSIVAAYPEVTFDIYHMGIPYARECGFLGKNYHNVYLNLCWSHIISPEMVVRTLGEWLDYVPTNKVFGFGGDFLYNPEQTWGALQCAKDNLAEVFARQIEKGVMDADTAEETLRLWLYDTPARVYKLDR